MDYAALVGQEFNHGCTGRYSGCRKESFPRKEFIPRYLFSAFFRENAFAWATTIPCSLEISRSRRTLEPWCVPKFLESKIQIPNLHSGFENAWEISAHCAPFPMITRGPVYAMGGRRRSNPRYFYSLYPRGERGTRTISVTRCSHKKESPEQLVICKGL